MATTIQIQVPADLKRTIDRYIAEGRATSEADYLQQAARHYAEELEADDDIVAIAMAGIADAEAGRFTLIETEADSEALRQRIMSTVYAALDADKK